LVKIGLVSYSLYLWQQLSLAPVLWAGQKTGAEVLYHGFGALLIVAFVPVAIASYFFLEKPLVAIGHRVSRRIIERDSKTAETEPVETTNDQRGLPSNA
jgi:peptidoglycan/LPS O-acetylase OafA/YrhL